MLNESISAASTTVHLSVDRIHAAVKALWRLLMAGLVVGLAYLLAVQIGDWNLFWQQQSVAFLAIGTFIAGLALVGVGIGFGGLRWLMLAAWPRRVGLQIDSKAIHVVLGPFGSDSVPWNELTCKVAEGFDSDMLSHVGDDAFTPVMLDDRRQRDLYAWMQSHSGVEPETLTHALRPHFESRLRDASSRDDR